MKDQTITGTRHAYGTADVWVETTDTFTGSSRATGTPTTIVPRTYYVEDENDWGYRNRVTITGQPVKKDGTLAKRVTRLDIGKKDVPDNVWAALLAMRPDLTPGLREEAT